MLDCSGASHGAGVFSPILAGDAATRIFLASCKEKRTNSTLNLRATAARASAFKRNHVKADKMAWIQKVSSLFRALPHPPLRTIL